MACASAGSTDLKAVVASGDDQMLVKLGRTAQQFLLDNLGKPAVYKVKTVEDSKRMRSDTP